MKPFVLGFYLSLFPCTVFAATVYSVGVTVVEDFVENHRYSTETVSETISEGSRYTTTSYLMNPQTKQIDTQKMIILERSSTEAAFEFTDAAGKTVTSTMKRSEEKGVVSIEGKLPMPRNQKVFLKIALTKEKRTSISALFSSENKILRRTRNTSSTVPADQFHKAKAKIMATHAQPTPR